MLRKMIIYGFLLAAVRVGCGEKEQKLPGVVIPGKEDTTQPGTPGSGETASAAPVTVTPGEQLPQWEEGYFDIHSINSGRGESFYYIFPDGTTLLIDAGGALPNEIHDYGTDSPGVPSKPN